jgi:hypothetical protein
MTRRCGAMNDGIMGPGEWARHEEMVAATPDVIDIGIGPDAQARAGIPARALGRLIRGTFHDLIDGGANRLECHLPGGDFCLYARRRGRSVDVGTRRDFDALGWGALCDVLEALRTGETSDGPG